jgi:hypothetical protein
MKKRVLICLFGLSRTFKQTSASLFEKLIIPNSDKYEFDIIINTDFEGAGICCGRPDTLKTGYSTYKYANRDDLIADLTAAYNKTSSLKHIQIYNFKRVATLCPFIIVYKRMHMMLSYMYSQNSAPYDLYIMHRIDSVFTEQIDLDKLSTNFTFITNNLARPGFFHNHDALDFTIIAPAKSFLQFMNEIIIYFRAASNMSNAYKDFFSDEHITGFESSAICESSFTINILKTIKAVHTKTILDDNVFDTNNNRIVTNVMSIDNISIGNDLLNILCRILHEINEETPVVFGHNLETPAYYSTIIR